MYKEGYLLNLGFKPHPNANKEKLFSRIRILDRDLLLYIFKSQDITFTYQFLSGLNDYCDFIKLVTPSNPCYI